MPSLPAISNCILKTTSARGSAGVAWRRLGSHFVVVELAIAVVLLVGAGLLAKSFYRLLRVDLNFQPDHLATLSIALNEHTYTNGDQLAAVTRHILESFQAMPGVQSVAITSLLPVTTNGNTDWIRFVGRPYDGKHIEVPERDISAGYFQRFIRVSFGAVSLRTRTRLQGLWLRSSTLHWRENIFQGRIP